MEWKIPWDSYLLDDISLVYEKAEEKEDLQQLLAQLEEAALREARNSSPNLKLGGESLTPERFDALPASLKEQIIVMLGTHGLASFDASMEKPQITVRLSPLVPLVQACTFFQIIHRLEKLDGAYNVLRFPQATLQIQAPLGGKKGLMRWELLILGLYPWLKVQEISTNEVAVPT